MADDRVARASGAPGGAFGPNAWLVDDMYEQYRADPGSVSESWREFFADYVPSASTAGTATLPPSSRTAETTPEIAPPAPPAGPATEAAPTAAPPAPAPAPAVPAPGRAGTAGALEAAPVPLRGAAARIAANMAASLEVPTATSVRQVPAKLLEANRSMLNRHLARVTGAKVSFTHLIGYAVVKALGATPALNASFVSDADGKGTPGVVRHEHVGLGLAVDVAKSDGTRSLLVPVIRDADTLDFRAFVVAYEELIRKVHTNKASPDDFAGATVTLTNPGTLGTVQSVPRLMPGQGAIIGVGTIGVPAEYQAADPRRLAALGVGPVVTLTSTYDHRIIQGAESGLFLSYVAECLIGEHDFYEDVFSGMDVPYVPIKWQPDVNPPDAEHERMVKQVHVGSLINIYRVRGHLIANLDPLRAEALALPSELDPTTYGLTLWDLDREFVVDGLAGEELMTLRAALGVLRDAYCRTLGIEYMHIQDPEQKRWIQDHVEGVQTKLSAEDQRHILDRLNAAEAFEKFLHSRYVGQKRFGLEGAESTIVLLDTILEHAAAAGMQGAVLGMAHRGRLNVLANIAGKSYGEIFREFEGDLDPESVQGSGDVKYHKGASGKFVARTGAEIPVTLASNPSHLEAVDPVVEGMVRAKQDTIGSPGSFSVLSLLVHGDAAFAGQGVVAETLELSQLAGYRTGGTIHVVVNNQLGFTTAPESARSSVYPTDVAKMVQSPILHVNGDDPEACARAAELAFGFRQAFHKDVVIDLMCYRRHGHNEGDDPSYTQPRMYRIIEAQRSVRKLYTESLVRRGDIALDEAEHALDGFQARLQAALDETRQATPAQAGPPSVPLPAPVTATPAPATGVERSVVERLAAQATSVPDGFTVHPKLARQFDQRERMVADGEIDWALAELLALGSVLLEGTDVRMAGQDTRRGTFSQRHAVLVDYDTGEEWVPLAHLPGEGTGRLGIYDSLLSEYAVVGFEYGYSVEVPDSLVVWEAQFGDFANGAQIIIDNFLVAAYDKWGQRSGLVLLLPHGYEGQGPEHSSGRIERFLTLCAEGNMRVTQPTTAAQYFHLLRSQVRGAGRCPLVVFTPKSLLRARASRSAMPEFTSGAFAAVVDDPATATGPQLPATAATTAGALDPGDVRRVVLCSGKVAFDVMARRDKLLADAGAPNGAEGGAVAVVRIEQLYPWPADEILGTLGRYPNADEVVFVQEEPENMGAWNFVHGRLHRLLRDTHTLRHVSRGESASSASGSHALHQLEHEDLLARAFSARPSAAADHA
ncbi:MAG TPA: multifunctional oxoglutarate decarboxylase/oxoglutarate dehydrogenase thiamine pyrophosphate-binding subunit/dihydrolipoyllysine-residue succinyltransferase subunit [Acidimicrobiales bacterium]|nr:multifunctional oxoglutarate decarboxylase/oxoglutarate dehydrogenase thiamine pyrophosphate-binding subunit/dihydrolipoyllysine-residue succinyltransferase subunit [Acidimicrobiales bacterium]